MFITPEQAKKLTDKELPADLLYRAQNIVETYVGKGESEIRSSKDKVLMARAVAYQAAYMKDNEHVIYEQVAVTTTSQAGEGVVFKGGDFTAPWIAPLVVIVTSHLSFRKSKRIKTGRIFQYDPRLTWRHD